MTVHGGDVKNVVMNGKHLLKVGRMAQIIVLAVIQTKLSSKVITIY